MTISPGPSRGIGTVTRPTRPRNTSSASSSPLTDRSVDRPAEGRLLRMWSTGERQRRGHGGGLMTGPPGWRHSSPVAFCPSSSARRHLVVPAGPPDGVWEKPAVRAKGSQEVISLCSRSGDILTEKTGHLFSYFHGDVEVGLASPASSAAWKSPSCSSGSSPPGAGTRFAGRRPTRGRAVFTRQRPRSAW